MKNKELKEFIYKNVYQNSSNGYVLTPSELAFEMVSTLPQSVFKSENTTFLDPICKSGTFLFEIVEKLYSEGHSISNIQSRIYTVDSNSHSLNVAQSFIRKILNKESGTFKFDYKCDFVEKFYNRLISSISKGKYTTLEQFLSIIILDKKEKHLMELLKSNISDFITQYEKVSKLESKLFGEVFTPRQLIDEMLDTLPSELWKNPELKWLDPAVGIGNFPAAILDRLMVGLNTIIPNEDERRKHILEEMLYMCDISSKNLFLLYMLFDKNNEFKLNVYRGSFLEEEFDKHMKEVWKLDGFSVVLGNPPYQDVTGKVGKTAATLWPRFLQKSIENVLLENGFLLLITPISWMSPGKQLIRNRIMPVYFKCNDFLHLNMDGGKYFGGVGSYFSYYLLKIKNRYSEEKIIKSNTCIISNQKNMYFDFSKFDFIPKPNDNNTLNIVSKVFDEKFDKLILSSSSLTRSDKSWVSKNKSIENIYPVKHTNSEILWSSKKPESFDIKKVILNSTGNFNPIYDDGNLGTTQITRWVVVNSEEEGKNLLNFLNSKIIKYVLSSCRWSGAASKVVFENIPSIDLSFSRNDNDFYKLFDLNQSEIDTIEKTIKD